MKSVKLSEKRPLFVDGVERPRRCRLVMWIMPKANACVNPASSIHREDLDRTSRPGERHRA